MGFRSWLEKDHSRSPVMLVCAYLVVVPIELFFGFVLGFIPGSLIKFAYFALDLPASVWHIAVYPIWIISGLGVLLLYAGGDPDGVAIIRLLRGRFKNPEQADRRDDPTPLRK